MSEFSKKLCRGPYGAPAYASHDLVKLEWLTTICDFPVLRGEAPQKLESHIVRRYLCQRCFEVFDVETIEKANQLEAQEATQ